MGLPTVVCALASLVFTTFIGEIAAKTVHSGSSSGDELCAAYFNILSDDGKDDLVKSLRPFSRGICVDDSVSQFVECSFKKNESCCDSLNDNIVTSMQHSCPDGEFFNYDKGVCGISGHTICPVNWLAKEIPDEVRKAVLSRTLAAGSLIRKDGGEPADGHDHVPITTITTTTISESSVITVIESVRTITNTTSTIRKPKGVSISVTHSPTSYTKTVTTHPPSTTTSVTSAVIKDCKLGTSITTFTKVATATADKSCSSWTRVSEETFVPPLPPMPDHSQHGCINCTLDNCMRCMCWEALKRSGSDHAHINDPWEPSRFLQCKGDRTVCQPCPKGLVWNCESSSCAAQGQCPDSPEICGYYCGMKPPVTKVTTLTTHETIVVTTILIVNNVTNTTDVTPLSPSSSSVLGDPSISKKTEWVDPSTSKATSYNAAGDYSITPAFSASEEVCQTKNDFHCTNSTDLVVTRPPPVTTIATITTTKSVVTTVITSVRTVTIVTSSTGEPEMISISVTESPTIYNKTVTTQPPSSSTSVSSEISDCNPKRGTSITTFSKVSESTSDKNCSSWIRRLEEVTLPTFSPLDTGQHGCIDCTLDDCMRCVCWQEMVRTGSNHAHINDPRQANRFLQCKDQRTVCQPCPKDLVWDCRSQTCASQGFCPDVPEKCWYVCGRKPPVTKVTTLTTREIIVVTTLVVTTNITNTTEAVSITPSSSTTPDDPTVTTKTDWVDHSTARASTRVVSGDYNMYPAHHVSKKKCDTKNDFHSKNSTNHQVILPFFLRIG